MIRRGGTAALALFAIAAVTGTAAARQGPAASPLKGLTTLGVVVEGLEGAGAKCGLSQEPLEAALVKQLSDAGFKVVLNSDEDSYLYVNVITASPAASLCVSRYDAFLYTHSAAKLSYQATPVLVEVSLLHKGGLTGGPPSAHGEAVGRGVREYVESFVAQIRDAK
jgi:hypothetical protein